jgi:4-amino-4-deoxy-L-arabinose transferase-like glycosyltransferase
VSPGLESSGAAATAGELEASRDEGRGAGPSRPVPAWLRRALALLAVALLVFLYLGRIGGFPLQDPDEGRYAEIPREMVESGDWLTPRLNYVKYYEKPPLLYWLIAASFTVFGPEEWAGRLIPALAGLATIAMTFAFGRAALGSRAAWIAAAVLATSPIFFGLSQAILIDTLLTACTTATLVSFWLAHRAERPEVRDRWVLAVAASAGLGVLAKGLVALVLPGAIALAALLVWRDFATLRSLVGWRPIALFLAIAAPWFLLVSRAHPEFAYFIFVREHFERFAAEVGHPEGPLYYVPVMLLGPLPWSLWAIGLACSRRGRAAFGLIPRDVRSFLAIWAGFVLVFFTIASSKLAPYVLPAFPALALLMGGWLDALLQRDDRLVARFSGSTGWLFGAIAAAGLVVAIVAWPAAGAISSRFHVPEDYVVTIARALLAVGAVLGATAVTVRSRAAATLGSAVAFAVLAAGMASALLAAVEGRAVVKTARSLGEAVLAHRREEDLVASYRHLMQGLSFYGRTRVVQVDAWNEIENGAAYAPDEAEWFWKGTDRLAKEWASPRRVFLATSRKKFHSLEGVLHPAPRLLARDHDRILLVNYPAEGSELLPASIAADEARR